MKIPSDMVQGTIHTTNNSGDLGVLSYERASRVFVKFPQTGYECKATARNIRLGLVNDKLLLPDYIDIGTIHKSNNCGDIQVLKKHSAGRVLVRFLNTGYESDFRFEDVRNGTTNDPYNRSVHGVGFIGVGNYKPCKYKSAHKSWSRMMERCYSENCQRKKPTYKGCYVLDEWHNFQNFAKWHEENYPKDGNPYQLDKDIKVDGNKVYGPDFCMYVTADENSIKAHARNASYINPNGELVEVYNITAFCREIGLCNVKMTELANGKRKSYNGWTKA